jgi:aspartokinase
VNTVGTAVERLEIFPLKLTESLALVSILGLPGQSGFARVLFGYLYRQGITTSFLAETTGQGACRDLVFTVSEEQLEEIQGDLESLRVALQADTVKVDRPVTLVRILGPHFDIRPGVAGYLFGRMVKEGIGALASSTTITTTLLVVPQPQAEQLIRLLKSIFVVPGKK